MEKQTFSFHVSRAETRTVVEVQGVAVVSTIKVETVTPGEVTKRALIDFVNANARKVYPDDTEDTEWEITVPGLGSVSWWENAGREKALLGLYSEVAQRLNGNGVSVVDWTPHCFNMRRGRQ